MERPATNRPLHSAILALASLFLVPIVNAQLLTPLDEQAAKLDRQMIPASGRHEALLSVKRFGRYSITAASTQGVALQLIDRMSGPRERSGIPGEKDGRIDVFLDRGEYKIIATGHDRSEGEAHLDVESFHEVSPKPAEQLVEHKPIATSLGDLKQRSYWLQIERRRWVYVEAAGRALRDLRFWRDGSWLVEGEPTIEILDPVEGQPLVSCRLALNLEPGLYLLTTYGGPPEPWAIDSDEYPLHVRLGIQTLPMAGRARFKLSPFGIDRWLVPAKANYFRLELPEAKPASLRVAQFAEARPFSEHGGVARIDKDSREPKAELENSNSPSGFDIVTVRSAAEQPYVLQHFEASRSITLQGSGEYWISTIHSGHPEDSVDITAFLAHWRYSSGLEKKPLREQTLVLSRDRGWASRCNLLESLSVFLDVRHTGTYAIESNGTEARFRIEPFFVYRPSEYEAPDFKQGDSEWELDAGYYVLTVEPVRKGILEVAVKPEGLLQNLLEKLGNETADFGEPVRGSATFPRVQLTKHDRYTLFLNHQPGVRAGLILRPLPLDLRHAIPMTIRPNEEITMSTKTSEESTLRTTTEEGTQLEMSLDGGPWRTDFKTHAGHHELRIRNQTDTTVVCSVSETPTRLEQTAALPKLPAATLDTLPNFSIVTQQSPSFFDLEQSEAMTFLLKAPQDGLFRLETTGLLDTIGNLRSRTVTSLAESSFGGTGRNFFLHQYLLSGDYQVRVQANGSSAGHLGLQLTRTDPHQGGVLKAGVPARASLDPGESIVYRFTIDKPGDYRLRSFALGRTIRCRLEDRDRWPIIKPNAKADITRHFESGDYRLVLLPESVEGRRLTLFERVEQPQTLVGHGPHPLTLGKSTKHRWHEPTGDAFREPDVWTFSLSGPTEVAIELNADMEGRLITEGRSIEAFEIPPSRGWIGRLEAGDYRLETTCSRRNNRVDYQVSVTPSALVAGVEREFTLPATVDVAVAGDHLIEISSLGTVDVRARLEDASGQLVLAGDDRPGDWNFHLADRLTPGRYTLTMSQVDGRSTSTRVRMEVRNRVELEATALPMEKTFTPGQDENIMPLLVSDGDFLLASIAAPEAMGMALERMTDETSWETIASDVGERITISVPITDAAYRLRIWSIDRRGGSARLQALTLTPQEIGENEFRRVVRLAAIPGFEPPTAVAAVNLQRAGTLCLAGDHDGVRWTQARNRVATQVAGGFLSSTTRRGWLTALVPNGRRAFKADRVFLDDQPLQIHTRLGVPVVVDLAESEHGPHVVVATSMLGQPAIRLGAANTTSGKDLATTSIDLGFAATASLDQHSQKTTVWLASNEIDATDIRLQRIPCLSPTHSQLSFGSHDSNIGTNEVLSLELPDGAKDLRLTLTEGVLAVSADRSSVTSLHHGGQGTRVETFRTTATSLLIVGIRSGSWALEVTAGTGRPRVVTWEVPFEERSARAGRVRLSIKEGGSDDRWLAVAGAVDGATFLSSDGHVWRGFLMPIGTAEGTLLLDSQPGLAMSWLGNGNDVVAGLWDEEDSPSAIEIAVPARLDLTGRSQSMRFESHDDALLQIITSGAGLFRISTGGDTRHVLLTSPGERHLMTPPGDIKVSVRGLADTPLSHPLHLALAPVTRISEGLGPEHLLGPGDGRAFTFTVEKSVTIGVGVRADPDTVRCELVDSTGKVMGDGIIQMHDLTAGDYYLLVRAPIDGSGVRIRPALVGIERPSKGPPEDVIRSYVTHEGGAS
ncbi:MAG: hypothetical protein GY906_39930 [bacterium]|nr:hypothetical protein [bacterium]